MSEEKNQQEDQQNQQEGQQNQGMADGAVDNLQERSSNQDSTVNQYVDTAQEKGPIQKAKEWIKEKLGRGSS